MDQDNEDLVETLEEVLDFAVTDNFHEYGDSEDEDNHRDSENVYHELEEKEEAEEEKITGKDPVPDYTDLDTDFGWEFYQDMGPGKPPWSYHDWSITQPPAAIQRYNVDYYSLVARTHKLAKLLHEIAESL